jgi:hypothetical protein
MLDPAKRPSPTRYSDIGHALVAKRTKEKHIAPHSETLGGGPTVAALHNGLVPAGGAVDNAAAHHSTANGSQPGTRSGDGGARKRHKKKHHGFVIRRPGALTALVGAKPSKHVGKVKQIAAHGTALQRKQANFYLNVLR